MCGICGYIGVSRDHDVTFDLVTRLFEKTEVRGEDAAGMWGAVDDKKVVYHKEPGKSSQFVKKAMWQKIHELHPNLLLCHARQASMGVGVPAINKNNHPFVSRDGSTGLIHNGRIPDVEYKALKKKFPTLSNTDSEILLRIFEASDHATEDRTKEFDGFSPDVARRLTGLKDIWSFLSLGHMAVAIGETKESGVRRLWLFRNKHRSLWLADMRRTLGQVFFFSVPQIWKEAVDNCPGIKPFLSGGVKLVELPTEEIWLFTTAPDLPLTKRSSLKRFEVCSSGSYSALREDQIAAIPSVERVEKIEVITALGEDDKLPEEERPPIGFQTNRGNTGNCRFNNNNRSFMGTTPRPNETLSLPAPAGSTQPQTSSAVMEEIDPDVIEKLCDSIRSIADDIKTVFTNQQIQASVSPAEFQDLKASLEQSELDLEGSLRILDR